jgi:hypothetical protein
MTPTLCHAMQCKKSNQIKCVAHVSPPLLHQTSNQKAPKNTMLNAPRRMFIPAFFVLASFCKVAAPPVEDDEPV